jgi:CheY-like chemotaxis protein
MTKGNSKILPILVIVLGFIIGIILGIIALNTAELAYLLVSVSICILSVVIAFVLWKRTGMAVAPTEKPPAIKVVAIDDEADILRLITIKLSKEGFDVSTAHDGEEGIKTVLKVLPDVMIVDVMMPGKDGYQVVSEVKKRLGEKAPIAIMLTSKAEEADMVKGLSAGANDYITKPFSPRELIERINVALIKVSKSPT